MGKKVDSSVLDTALSVVSGAAVSIAAKNTTLTFCSAEPANFAGIAAVKLCSKTGLTAAAYTIAAGTGTNRKVTVAAQTGMVATAGAPTNAVYACVDDGTTLLMGTTVTAFSVTSGGTYNSAAVVYEIAQPT